MALRSRSPRTMPLPRQVGEIADGDVGADRQVEQQAVALAVLGQERDAGAAGVARRADRDRPAVDADLALGGHAAVDAVQDLAAAGAEQAGEADDLAGGDGEADVLGAEDGAGVAGDGRARATSSTARRAGRRRMLGEEPAAAAGPTSRR